MANELQKVLDDIKLDKNTNLKPRNLKTGCKVLGVSGAYAGEAVNAIYSCFYEMNDDYNLYSLSSDGSERTPYELDGNNLIIYTGDDDKLSYEILEGCLEVTLDG